MVGQMMNKNTQRYPTNFTDRIAISVHKCHSSPLIFKIIMQIQVHGKLTTTLKVIRQIVMTLFSDPAIGAGLKKNMFAKLLRALNL